MTTLAWGVTTVLLTVGVLHLLWAIGIWWPIRDESALARATIGSFGVTKMPGAVPCALVAVALFFAASLPHTPNFPAQSTLMTGAAFVFLARGLAGFTTQWRRLCPEQPFADLDRRYYSPLCVLLGLGLTILVLEQ